MFSVRSSFWTLRDAAAATDVTMRAEILTYSRSRGLFAGVSLEGSTLRPDNDANRKLYGKELPEQGHRLAWSGRRPRVGEATPCHIEQEVAAE
jgi:hypothetical protein